MPGAMQILAVQRREKFGMHDVNWMVNSVQGTAGRQGRSGEGRSAGAAGSATLLRQRWPSSPQGGAIMNGVRRAGAAALAFFVCPAIIAAIPGAALAQEVT